MSLSNEQIAAINATPYAEMVTNLVKPGSAIIEGLTIDTANALHMAVGVSGEAGELLDCIKRHSIYGKPIDLENLKEELGDIEFYLEGLRQQYGISREETMTHNKHKLLGKRYASGKYSDQQAIDRADKEAAA